MPEDELWESFEKAKPGDKAAIFLNALEAGKLDGDDAFEMLSEIYSTLDPRAPADRARYIELVKQLHQQAPPLYERSFGFYQSTLINLVIADGRWEALPELMSLFVEKPEHDIDAFFRVVDMLLYHGQVQILLQAMAQMWPTLSKSDAITPWGIDEFIGIILELHLFDHLEKNPQPDVAALRETTAPYGKWKEGWLEWALPHLSAPMPSSWQPSDFGEAVDADRWQENLNGLLLEFIADRRRADVPYSRSDMAWAQLAQTLERQWATPAPKRGKRSGKAKKHARTVRVTPASPLIPRYQTLEKTLVELFPFLAAQPYKAAALMELLPAYLHFLARLGLIHPTEMDAALAELQPLMKHVPRILEDCDTDPRAVDTVVAAWSNEALNSLRDDPALAQARANPPAPPPEPPKPPARRTAAIQTYTFKVTYLRDPDVWRTIEIAENQTLHDLHDAIQEAVDFDADHLYSFYMSGKAWDSETEHASPYADSRSSAARVRIGDLGLRMKQRFLYLFDYGDEHHFEVQLVGINPDAPREQYPRVVERHGKNPPQYGLDWEEDEWDEEEDWDEEDWDLTDDDAEDDV